MVVAAYGEAVADGAQVVVFSELTVTGYPPEDLLLKPAFVEGAAEALAEIARHTGAVPAVVGFPEDTGRGGPIRLWNSAAMCWDGAVRGVFRKHLLPNYAVFDEQRYFVPGTEAGPLLQAGEVRVGVSICEDLWGPPHAGDAAHGGGELVSGPDGEGGLLADPEGRGGLTVGLGGEDDISPVVAQVAMGAQLPVVLNGSPFHRGKQGEREVIAGARAVQLGVPVVYVNQVGGQDELVFDGGSFVTDAEGRVICRLPSFREQVTVCDVPLGEPAGSGAGATGNVISPALDPLEEVWQALVVATRDYVRKNGFSAVAVGLSGGIDSSAVAAIAADALGPAHVHGVSMPSRYSSDGSRADAAQLAANLGIDFRTVPIEPAHAALSGMLTGAVHFDPNADSGDPAAIDMDSPAAGDLPTGDGADDAAHAEGPGTDPGQDGAAADLTDQNLQSRIRGVVLMALSNRFGWLVLTTGNKTETSVGYTTLYGDTAGAYAVIRDVPKLLVYELCEWRNRQGDGERIPQACIDKPPSAELRPDQRDDQSLPPYELLDPLVEAYVEGDLSAAEMLAQPTVLEQADAEAELVRRITRLVDIAEYKRRQSPPGPRITAKSFGKDRRMPITNFFR